MSSRTSVCWWSTFTKPRLKNHAQRCSQSKWRLVVRRTRSVTLFILLAFSYAAYSAEYPWTSCCPSRWETTGHPRRWARDGQGVDTSCWSVPFEGRFPHYMIFLRSVYETCSKYAKNATHRFNIVYSSTAFNDSHWGRNMVDLIRLDWLMRMATSHAHCGPMHYKSERKQMYRGA